MSKKEVTYVVDSTYVQHCLSGIQDSSSLARRSPEKSDAFSFPDAAVSHGRLETRGISAAAANNFVHEFPGSVAVQVGCWKP